MNAGSRKAVAVIAVMGVIAFAVTFAVIVITQNVNKPDAQVSEESAAAQMDRLLRRVRVNTLEPVKGNVDLSEANAGGDLPDVDEKYPPGARAATADYIDIMSSTEKATDSASDRWLLDMAERFNRSGATVNGRDVSVQVRGIASGAGMDYILSGKYVPDAFTPSNELWGDALAAGGVSLTLAEPRLCGNVAGIALSRAKADEVSSKYGSISMKTITQAVTAGELNFGYTNPFASSTGANFLMSTLYSLSPDDPFSDESVSAFEDFQANVPFVAYTTLQMKEAAKSGVLDGFVFESQQFANTPDLRDYVLTPFGVRHDSPVYALGNLSAEKREILDMFITFCKSPDSQEAASRFGFNQHDGYVCEIAGLSGKDLSAAQKLYKEKKNQGREVMAVFVADISGSMDGAPLARLKESLTKGAKFIGSDVSVGLVTFSNDVNIAVPIGKFDIGQRSLFAGAIEEMDANGGTAMYDAILVAEDMLWKARQTNPGAKLMLFVLTDGETNRGADLSEVRPVISGLRAPIYTIGYNADIKALQEVSAINEAASINADTADVVYQLQSLFNAEM
ncbi:MAG: substrate-binding and VWA domain-containing protein [Clostridiales bacterium]|jgi:Ca-activated chloride channel family protein|nr:substrate-binding and VWA domain-containing protein [Clostridiales bacterium]